MTKPSGIQAFSHMGLSSFWTAFCLICLSFLWPINGAEARNRVGEASELADRLEGKMPPCGILPIVALRGSPSKPIARQLGVGWLVSTSKGPKVITPAHVVAGGDSVHTFCRGRTYSLELESFDSHQDLAVLGGRVESIESDVLIRFPLSSDVKNLLKTQLQNSKNNLESDTPAAAALVGIDFRSSAHEAPELWMNTIPYHFPSKVFDLSLSPGVRPGLSGAAVIARIFERVLPLGMVQQTLNPGEEARGLSLERIESVVESLVNQRKQDRDIEIVWTLKPTQNGVMRSRSAVLKSEKNDLRFHEVCTSAVFSTMSRWSVMGGADWGDGGGSDWADGGEGKQISAQTHPRIPRSSEEAYVHFDFGHSAANMNFFPIPFNYFDPKSESSRCKSVGLSLADGRILVGLRPKTSLFKSEFVPLRELEDLFELKNRMKRNLSNQAFYKFILEHAVWLPSDITQLVRMPVCDFIGKGIYQAGGGGLSVDYGEIEKFIGWMVGPSLKDKARVDLAKGLSLSCTNDETEVMVRRHDFELRWNSSGVSGWFFDGVKKNLIQSPQRDLQVIRVQGSSGALNIQVPFLKFEGAQLKITQSFSDGRPWLKITSLQWTDGRDQDP